MNPALPIDGVLPQLAAALRERQRVVLEAPPGAGKTTRVPLALLQEGWLAGMRIIMLEPRRLAARAAAGFMARRLGEAVGDTVGYRVRLDSRVSAATRVEVVTEGVLTRMLQDDPSLEGTGLLIFDEFHERSIHADLGLALALQSQALLRPDLRLLVMSATLDTPALAALLGDAPVVRSEGRAHPVETIHLEARPARHIEATCAASVLRALHAHEGDVLVFLPGAAEIARTAARLAELPLPPGTAVVRLAGDLPQHEQDRAIAPAPAGTRKVVLATAIAETSLTIEGVRVVIDSGLMRVPRFSPRSGMTRLVTVTVSRASADQRRGRAGRLGPGTCYRLWTRGDDAGLLPHRPPEILEADLAPLALELAAWGVADPSDLRWIDAPPAAAFAQARELLTSLDAVDADARITPHGRAMARLATHPRLAHMLLRARELDDDDAQGPAASLACELAALLGERDPLRTGRDPHRQDGAPDAGPDPDVRLRLPVLHGAEPPHGHEVDRGALHRVRAEIAHWRRRMRLTAASPTREAGPRAAADVDRTDELAGLLLAFAYPDRIGQRRGGRGRFVLRNGSGAAVDAGHNLAGEEFVVAAEIGGRGRQGRIFLGAPLSRAAIEAHFASSIITETRVRWDAAARVVRAAEVRRLGALVLAEAPAAVSAGRMSTALLEVVRREGLEILTWSRDAQLLRQRLAFLHRHLPAEWPDVSDAALVARLEEWLLPWLENASGSALREVDVGQALLGLAGWERRAALDSLAPTHLEVPSGSRIAVDYTDPAAPVLAVRLQEMFGLADTPRIAADRVPLTLHLLSPARRPVQVTRDLASFWRSAYFEVRRDLRGRYPRHYWPEDPLQAEPTRRTRPR